MKKQSWSLLSLLAAGLMLCACSSSDDVVEESATTDTSSDGNTYVSVALNMGGASVTRATATYDAGESYESTVTKDNSIFLFYDSDGNYLTDGTIADFSTTESTTSESTSSSDDYAQYATVVLGPTTSIPSKMLALLNVGADSDLPTNLKNKSLSDVYSVTTSYLPTSSTSEGSTTWSGFIMANALQYSADDDGNNAFTYGVDINENAITTSETDAKGNTTAQEIYVEREVAKVTIETAIEADDGVYSVDLTSSSDESSSESSKSRYLYTASGDGTTSLGSVTVNVVIDGWTINAINSTGHVLKNYDSEWSPGTDWYESTSGYSNRLFWAKDDNYTYSSTDAVTITGSESTTGGTTDITYSYSGTGVFKDLTYKTYAEAKKAGTSTDAAYYHENTAPYDAQVAFNDGGEQACVPTLLLATHLTIGVTSSESTTTYDLSVESGDDDYSTVTDLFEDCNVYYCSGSFYTLAAVEAKIAADLKTAGYYWSSDGSTKVYISGDDLTLTFAESAYDNSGRIKVTAVTVSKSGDTSSSYTLYDSDGSSATLSADDINKTSLLATSTDSDGNTTGGLFCYAGGKMYYQTPIDHLSASSDIDNSENFSSSYTFKGLVRNHSYTINIKNITGLGWPVYDEDEPLVYIPGSEKNYYVTCTINILDWYKNDTQDVTF